MSDDIVIRIKTLLEKASQEDLNKVKSDIEQRVNPKIKIDVDTKNLDKVSEKYVQIENAEAKITEITKEWTKANGETVKQIDNIKAGTNEVTRRVTETTTNYKKQRAELEKINAEQSKYWSQRVKETVGDMTKKPDELVKMADYYNNLEKSNLDIISNAQNKNFNEAKEHLTQLSRLRKEYHGLDNKNTEQAKELTKQMTYHQGQYNNIIRRKIDIGEKTKIEGIEAEKLNQLEKIREQTLRNVGAIKAKNIDKDIIQQQKLTSEIHKQSLAQQDLLNRIRGMRGVDGKFIVGDNLSALNTLESQIRGFDPTNKNFSKNMAEANSKLREISTTTSIYKKEIQDANKYTGLFGQSIFEAGKKFASWLFIGNIIIGITTSIKTGIQAITDIDTALTNLNKVTDETRETLNKFSFEAHAIGRNLAKTNIEVINSTTEFARLGYSLEQSAQLAKQALLYSNVGDIGVEEASLAIISAVKGFGVAVDEEGRNIQKIVDIYNEVGNNFAISSAGIGEAMRRSAASLYSAGNTIEEAVALITASNSVVQDPSAVGTALKTISMRLRGVSEDGEDVLEYLPKLEEAFRNVGIEMRKDENTFKSTYELMSNLAEIWDELTDVQRAYMSELVAGKRQGNIVMAMMSNFKDAQDSLTSALNSTNSALIENEKYMSSIEARKKQLSANIIEFWSNAMDSNFIKNIVIVLDKLVDVLDFLINNSISAFIIKVTLITTVIYGLGVAIKALVGTAVFGKLISSMSSFIYGANIFIYTISALITKTITLNSALNLLKATMISHPLFFITLGVTAIYGIVKGIDALTTSSAEAKQQLEELNTSIKNLKSSSETMGSNIDIYEQLHGKVNLLTEDKQKLTTAMQELGEEFPDAIIAYNEEGKAIELNTKILKEHLKAKQDEIKLKQDEVNRNFRTNRYGFYDIISDKHDLKDKWEYLKFQPLSNIHNANQVSIEKLTKDIEKYNKALDKLKTGKYDTKNVRGEKMVEIDDTFYSEKELESLLSSSTTLLNKFKDKQKDAIKQVKLGIRDAIETDDDFSNLKNINDNAIVAYIDSIVNNIDKLNNKSIDPLNLTESLNDSDQFISKMNEINNQFEKNKNNVNLTEKQYKQWRKEVIKSLSDVLLYEGKLGSRKLADDLAKGMIDRLGEVKFASTEGTTALQRYQQAVQALGGVYKDSSVAIKELQGFLDELNNKNLSMESVQKLLENYPELIQYLGDEKKLREEITKRIEDYQNAIYDAFALTKQEDANFYNSIKNNNKSLFDNLSNFYKNDVSNWTTLAQAKITINSSLIKTLGDQWEKYFSAFQAGETISYSEYNKLSGMSKLKDSRTPLPDSAIQQFKLLDELNKAARKQAEAFKNLNVSSGLGKSSSSSSKSFEKTFEVWKELLEAINREIETLKDQLDDVTSFEQKTEIYDQMILLLEKKQNLLLDISKTFDSNLQQAEQKLRSYIGKGLSESDFNKIMSGSTDTIEVDIKNEKIAKAIEDFKKLKDSAEGLKKEIQGIDDEIRDLSFAEFKINLSIEDNKLSDLTQEKENLRNEMSLLEKGSVEYIALLERENQINIESVNILRNKIALVQQELASDRYNADQKKELIDTLKQLKQEYVNLQFQIKQQLASVADEIIQIYKNIYEKQKQAALNALDEQMKAEERRHKRATDNIDDELKQFENYINAKLKALDKEENEHDYQRELDKKQKAILETQKNIDILSLDDSWEAKAKREELIKQLAQQEDEINEYQHDHSIDLRKENLKDQLDSYKKDIDAKKKAEDTKLNLEKDRLDRIKKETERHYDDLINDEQKFAQIRSDIINGNIDKVKSAFAEFKTFVNGNLEFIGNSISANLITKMEQALALLESANSANMSIPSLESTNPSSNTSGRQPMAVLDSGSFELVNNRAIMQSRLLASLLGASADWEGYGQNQTIIIGGKRFKPAKNVDGTTYLSIREVAEALGHQVEWDEKKRQIRIYHDGGIVGNESFGFVDKFNKLFNTNANEHIIKALTNEILIPPKNITKYLIPNMQKLIANATPQLQFTGGGVTNIYHLNMEIGTIQGNREGGQTVFKEVVRGLKSMGK